MAEPVFTLKSSTTGGQRLDVVGELDLAASSSLRAALAELANGGHDVTLDLSAVTFIDSTALSVLVDEHTEWPRGRSPDGDRPVVGRRAGLALGWALHTPQH